MFKTNIKAHGTRDKVINNIIAYCDVESDPDEFDYIFTDTGVAPCIDGHIWPERPWSEFGTDDLIYFDALIARQKKNEANLEKWEAKEC